MNEKEEAQKSALELYDLVRKITNRVLHDAKSVPIGELQEEDPSYSYVAKLMRDMAIIIEALCETAQDPMTGQKAHEYATFIKEIALAIDEHDEANLSVLTAKLDKRSIL